MKKKIVAWILLVCMLLSIPGNTILASQDVTTVKNVSEDEDIKDKLKSNEKNPDDTELMEVGGDTKAASISSNISVNTSYTGQLLKSNDVNTYNFSLTSAGKVNVTFGHAHISSTNNYWIIRIYNEKQDCVMRMDSAGSETSKTSCDVGLPAGSYYVEVRSNYHSTEIYTLQVNYFVSDKWEKEVNDSTANEVKVNQEYSGALQFSEDKDNYSFTVSKDGVMNISFIHPHVSSTNNYWIIYLYNDKLDCVLKMYSAGSETSKTSCDVGLPAGNYYMKVESYYHNTGTYTFKVNYSASDKWEREVNDSTANEVKVNQEYSGALQFSDDKDNYSFTVSKDGVMNISFIHPHVSSTSNYWIIYLYNDKLDCVLKMYSAGSETSKTSYDVGLPAGNYYMKVESYYHNTGTYTFKVNYSASDKWEREVNDSTANEVKVNQEYSGALQFSDDKDNYFFTLENDGKVDIFFSHEHLTDSYTYWKIYIYNDKQECMLTLNSTGTEKEKTSVAVGLPAGTYYLEIKPYGHSTETYTFKINYTKSSKWETEKNDGYQTADSVKVGTEYNGAMQFSDDVDFYKFSVKEAGYFYVVFKHDKINSTSAYWKARIYDDNTKELGWFEVTGTNSNGEFGSIYLDEGTYYFKTNTATYHSEIAYKFKIDYALKADKTTLKTSNAAHNKIKLSWDKLTDADGYIIYRSTSKKGDYKKIKTVKGVSKCSYTDSAVKTGTKYYYKVRAYKTVAGKKIYSKYSSVKSITAKPATVSIGKAKAGTKKATISWKKQSGVSGYEIYMSTKKSSSYKKVKTVSKASTVNYTKKSLKKGKTYYFKVRSYKVVNGKKVYGVFSKVKSVKIKK